MSCNWMTGSQQQLVSYQGDQEESLQRKGRRKETKETQETKGTKPMWRPGNVQL